MAKKTKKNVSERALHFKGFFVRTFCKVLINMILMVARL